MLPFCAATVLDPKIGAAGFELVYPYDAIGGVSYSMTAAFGTPAVLSAASIPLTSLFTPDAKLVGLPRVGTLCPFTVIEVGSG